MTASGNEADRAPRRRFYPVRGVYIRALTGQYREPPVIDPEHRVAVASSGEEAERRVDEILGDWGGRD